MASISPDLKNARLADFITEFCVWLTRLNYASSSIEGKRQQLSHFIEWLSGRGITQLTSITDEHLIDYHDHLRSKSLRYKTISGYISTLKQFDEYLVHHDYAPIMTRQLPTGRDLEVKRALLSAAEVKKLYAACGRDLYGLRDRVILAIFYGCGLRCSEGARLKVGDLDMKRAVVHVRVGKGYRSRYVPMSTGVKQEVATWMESGQPYFFMKSDLVIPSRTGGVMGCHGLTKRVKQLCARANVRSISLHGLRHSIATHLLASGMPLDQISRFLGHRSLETTQIYTRVSDH